jgi:TatD family-associated radical SAM protein
LWLRREPTVEEILDAIERHSLKDSREVIFCGYGESTTRLPELIEVAEHLRRAADVRVRLDTNGQGNLINHKEIIADIAEVVDAVSISLNAGNSSSYQRMCRSVFGEESYAAVLHFAEGCTSLISDVTLSVVDVIDDDEMQICRGIAAGMGAEFRVRPFTNLRTVSNERQRMSHDASAVDGGH